MKEERFVSKNMAKWKELEGYNQILSKKGIRGLNKDEIKAFTGLYRDLSHQLSYARTYFPGSNITVYLNQIISISHNYIFTREPTGLGGIKHYFTKGFRAHFRKYLPYFFTSAGIFLSGMLLCFFLVLINPYWGEFFFPGALAENLNLSPENVDLTWLSPLLSSFIITNNIRVCLFAFALGATFGLGTIYILFYNGMNIGALLGIVVRGGGYVTGFWAMILPHGFLELTAIFLSGAAGLIIGKSILMPGQMVRKDAAVKGAKEAAYFIPGIVIMLVAAGIIEGYFTPLSISAGWKLVFAFMTLGAMLLYFGGFFYCRVRFVTGKNVVEVVDTH